MEGLSESQEEEARRLVISHPDLIRNSEEAEAVRPLIQNKFLMGGSPSVPRNIVMGMSSARKRSRS